MAAWVERFTLKSFYFTFQVAALFRAGFTSQNENLRPTVLVVWIVGFGDEKFHQQSGEGNGF
jgi:hypothetical protein